MLSSMVNMGGKPDKVCRSCDTLLSPTNLAYEAGMCLRCQGKHIAWARREYEARMHPLHPSGYGIDSPFEEEAEGWWDNAVKAAEG